MVPKMSDSLHITVANCIHLTKLCACVFQYFMNQSCGCIVSKKEIDKCIKLKAPWLVGNSKIEKEGRKKEEEKKDAFQILMMLFCYI